MNPVNLKESLVQLNGSEPELDIEFAKRMRKFYNMNISGEPWQFNAEDIVDGFYPLDELPDHVRDILQTQFYQDK